MRLQNKPLNSESFSNFFKYIPIPTFAWQIVGEELVLIDFNDATEKLSFEGVSLGIKASELFKDDGRILTNLFSCLHEKSNFSEECEYQLKKTGEQKKLSTSFTFIQPDLVILHIKDLTMQTQVRKALQKARDVLTGLEMIINQSPAVVFLLRNEKGWPVEYITDNIRQFGYEASDFYSHMINYADIIHPDDIENIVTEVYLKCQDSATEFVQEYRIVSKPGESRWINVRTWIKRNRENIITHFQGIILDITERRETEEKLKESDEKFKKITEQSLLGVLILQKGKVKYINKGLAEIAEFEPKEIKNWPINEFAKSIFPEDLPMVMRNMQVKLEENKDLVTRYAFRIITKSKKIKWLEAISKVISYQGDLAILATLIEVTEKKEAEIKLKESEENLKKLNEALEQKVSERTRDLKESEEKYRVLYNQTPIGIGTATKDGKLIAMNKVMEEMLGYGIEEINAMGISSLYVNPYRREQLLSTLKKEGRLRDFEVSLKRRDGIEFLTLMNTDIIDLNGEKILHTTVRDIAERKKAEQKLRESEKKYREILDNMMEGYFETDLKGTLTFVNDFYHKLVGYSKEDIIGTNYRSMFDEDRSKEVYKKYNQLYNNKISSPLIYENNMLTKSGETVYYEVLVDLKYDSEGNKVGFFGLFRDITERKKINQKLKESEEILRAFMDSSPNSISILDSDLNYLEVNEDGLKEMGKTKEEIIGKNILEINPNIKNTGRYDVYLQVLKTGKPHFAEDFISKSTKDIYSNLSRELHLNINIFKVGEGLGVIVTDITKRKKSEQKLKESEEKYRGFVNNISDIIYELDISGKCLYVSLQLFDISGFTPEEIIGQNVFKYVHPDDLTKFAEEVKRAFNYDGSFYSEFRLRHKDGQYVPISSRFNVITIGGKQKLTGVLVDMTERKEADQELKDSGERYRILFEDSPFTIGILDRTGKILDVNSKHNQLGGYDKEYLVGKKFTELSLIPKEFFPVISNSFKTLVKNGYSEPAEVQLRDIKGNLIWYFLQASLIKLHDKTLFQIISQNINERKQAELKLKESEEKFRNIAEQSLMAICIAQDDVIKYANQRMVDIIGYSVEEITNWQPKEFYKTIVSESLDFIADQAKKKQLGLPGAIPHYTFQIIKKSGENAWIENFSKTINFEGNPASLVTFFDVTDKKKVEQELKESEEKYRFISENANDLICLVDDKWRFQYCNEAYKRILGYDPKELVGTFGFNFIHQEDAEKAQEQIRKSFVNGIGKTVVRMRRKDGIYRWIESSIRNYYNEDNKIQNSIGVSRDITDQKEAEIKLKESEEKYRLITENANDFVYVLNRDLQFEYINEPIFKSIMGYTYNDLIGHPSTLVSHIEDTEKAKNELKRVFENKVGSECFYEIRDQDKKGIYHRFEVRGKTFIDHEEKLKVLLIARDVTERKLMEQKIKESELNYKEAYSKAEFYKDIFTHDINNILSNIKSSIELSAMYLKNPNRMADVEELYESIRGQFTKGSDLVSNIRKMSQLDESTSMVYPVEIYNILKQEIDFILESYQTRDVKIRTHGFDKKILVNANDLLLDLFNNLLNNAIKYNDSQIVEIDVKISKEKKDNNDYVKLEFTDNGIGISDERKNTLFEKAFVKDISSKGLGIGLTLVKKIVDSYEGEIWIEDGTKGDYRQGANFIVLIPEAI